MELAFTGEVIEAGCECHKGEIVVVVFAIHPTMGRITLGHKNFKTVKEGEEALQATVMECAEAFMKKFGLKKETAKNIKISTGEDALKDEQRYMNEYNKDLH